MFLRFLIIGAAGFLVDSGLTMLFIKLGVDALLARAPGIGTAIVFTWLANRYFTFRIQVQRSVQEAARYVSVALFSAAINYTIYLGLVTTGLHPFVAITVATALQTGFSFFAYRNFAFRERQ
jgi:putative flippase GtrA